MIGTARLEMLARQAGLERTLRDFPDDVAEAAAKAAALSAEMERIDIWPVEVWPAMRLEATHD